MMARAAGLNADKTGRKLAEERYHLATTQCPSDNNSARLINAMDLKNVLGEINAHRGNSHSGWLLLFVVPDENHTLALRCREREPSTPSAFGCKADIDLQMSGNK
jgi:hypothetical protein